MATNYDKLYGETANALGSPTQAFVAFFEDHDARNLRVLDVGCGQGRDALMIARRGHEVTGVDISPNGIEDLTRAAEQEGLAVKGVVSDIRSYQPDGLFDVIVIDRTLHMLEKAPRMEVLQRLLGHVEPHGWVLIADETLNIPDFLGAIESHALDWTVTYRRRGYLFVHRM